MRIKHLLICVCFVGSGASLVQAEGGTAHVEQGALRGRRVPPSAAGGFQGYWSFQGVPYAKAPLGPLRFKDPEPAEPWDGVRDATEEGGACIQFDPRANGFAGSEDCLFLNVYTPRLPPLAGGAEPLPVMLFIHGGGPVTADVYAPDYFVNESVVLVTFYYRQEVLGFLYLDEAAPGNAGLKDQVMAMRWVRDNIMAFGGDPHKVTIFGESIGGAFVHLHMLSPMTEGLFRAAIAQSGAALNPWAQQQNPQESALRLARAVGCAGDDPYVIVDCLRRVDGIELATAAQVAAPTERNQKRLLPFTWVPTPDYNTAGVPLFAAAPFRRLVDEGRSKHVPYMTGHNSEEAYIVLAMNITDYSDEHDLQELDKSWEFRVLPELDVPVGHCQANRSLEKVKRFYLGHESLNTKTLPKYIDMISDILFRNGIRNSVNAMVKSTSAPVYVYSFIADDKLNFLKPIFNIKRPGAAHGDELGYLFNAKALPHVAQDSPAGVLRRKMVRMWTNFAKTGDPTGNDTLLNVEWKPYTRKEKNYLEIGVDKLQPGVDLLAKQTKFWDDFYREAESKSKVRGDPCY